MSEVVTFDGAPPAGTINFGVGQPSADLLPLELVAKASSSFFASAKSIELNYGATLGDVRFLDSLAVFLSEGYQSIVSPEDLLVTAGNSQALDLVSMIFAKPGDTVFVEEPSYFLAFKIFRDRGLNIVGIPLDKNGLRIDALQEALELHTPAFLYTIPSYQNPSGLSTSTERRQEIIELSIQHDFLIIADEVYQFLYYEDKPPPAFGTMIDSERVISLGSFSKILAPAMRLGWIQTSAALRKKFKAAGFVNSGGSLNHISSLIVRQAINNKSLNAHIDMLKSTYKKRVQAMDESLHKHFDGIAEWARPGGGYFFWLQFEDDINTTRLRDKARELKTGFQPGSVFSSKDELNNFIRLSFAHYSEADIHEGVARLRQLFMIIS
ncbi:MAG: aminotransferase class I/II-fold pyridoxal phosphate-dependent enzyme [Gammaproteobacteria bacterium]|nr:aminotransferase class I/II-fold pyridoxal phosphate-dependent enzyme [Gammaproteobacteria bacterium]